MICDATNDEAQQVKDGISSVGFGNLTDFRVQSSEFLRCEGEILQLCEHQRGIDGVRIISAAVWCEGEVS